MATLLFLCLKASKVYDTPVDWAVFCLLLALEGPQYLRVWLYWKAKR